MLRDFWYRVTVHWRGKTDSKITGGWRPRMRMTFLDSWHAWRHSVMMLLCNLDVNILTMSTDTCITELYIAALWWYCHKWHFCLVSMVANDMLTDSTSTLLTLIIQWLNGPPRISACWPLDANSQLAIHVDIFNWCGAGVWGGMRHFYVLSAPFLI